MSETIRNRALSAFIGLAIGDALGTTLEFEARDGKPSVYDMVGGGPFDLLPELEGTGRSCGLRHLRSATGMIPNAQEMSAGA